MKLTKIVSVSAAAAVCVCLAGCGKTRELAEELEILLNEESSISEEAATETAVVTTSAKTGSTAVSKKTTKVTTVTSAAETNTEKEDDVQTASSMTAAELVNKSIPQIIELMGGKFTAYYEYVDGMGYFSNQDVFPGMEFYFSGDDIYSRDGGQVISDKKILSALKKGSYALWGIEVSGSGRASGSIRADMSFSECCSVLGDFGCVAGSGGFVSGSVESAKYVYIDGNAKFLINFSFPEMYGLVTSGDMYASYEEMLQYDPSVSNVLVYSASSQYGGPATTKPASAETTKATTTTVITTTTEAQSTEATVSAELLANTYYRSEYVLDPESVSPMNPEAACRYSLIMDDEKHITMSLTYMRGYTYIEFDVESVENGVYSLINGIEYDSMHSEGEYYAKDFTGILTMNSDGTFRLEIEELDFDWLFEIKPM